MKLIDKNALNFTDFEMVMCDGDFAKAFKLICEKLDDAPIIEAEPTKHGHWVGIDDIPHETWECDRCGKIVETDEPPNYCENCGADMRERREDGERD